MNPVETSTQAHDHVVDKQRDSPLSSTLDSGHDSYPTIPEYPTPPHLFNLPVLSPLASPFDKFSTARSAFPSPTSSSPSSYFSQSRVFKSSKCGAAPTVPASPGEPLTRRPTLPKELLIRHAGGAIDFTDEQRVRSSSFRSYARDSQYSPSAPASSPPISGINLSRIPSTGSMPSLAASNSNQPPGSTPLPSPLPTPASSFSGSNSSPTVDAPWKPFSLSPNEPPVITTHFPFPTVSPTAKLVGDTSAGPIFTPSQSRAVSRRSCQTRRGHQYALSLSELMEINDPRPSPVTLRSADKSFKSSSSRPRPGCNSPKPESERQKDGVLVKHLTSALARKLADLDLDADVDDDYIYTKSMAKIISGRDQNEQAPPEATEEI